MMSHLLFLLVFVGSVCLGSAIEFPALDHIRPSASPQQQTQAASDLIGRVLGSKASHFKVIVKEMIRPAHKDVFNIVSDGTSVTITATTGVTAALGFYHFIKGKCGCQYTWAGQQLNLPSPLPVIASPGITVTTNDRFRYYQNVCTVSYSFVWWDWARWQREIDWMAMNGINLPLAFTGQEAIFQRVYMSMGFSKEELGRHFGGPAFLAWARMGNMHGWGGPLPESWHDNQLALQHKILPRMRELGMIPVLPGFAGHVPETISTHYPNATVSRLGDWGGFNNTYCCTYLLDFEDPLFNKIGTAFIQEMQHEFGVDHIYNADSFNEMTPKSGSAAYLKSAGSAVYRAMTSADPDAIWLMQGWLFESTGFWKPPQIQALLQSVPQGKMIVLDLFAEALPVYQRTESFYGQPFIWCMLHNFGGTMEMYGIVDSVNKGPFEARKFPNSTMIGTGLTPEGINQNEAVYELMNENAIASAPRNLTIWFHDYPISRYGQQNDAAIQAWQLLKTTVMNCTFKNDYCWVNSIPWHRPSLGMGESRSVYNATDNHQDFSNGVIPTSRPNLAPLNPDGSVFNNTDGLSDHSRDVVPTYRPRLDLQPDIWYNPADLFEAWRLMLKAAETLSSNELFRYDLVDITRNSLQIISLKFYHEMVAAYRLPDRQALVTSGYNLIYLLQNMDELLQTDKHFLLGNWIRDARSNGVTDAEKDLMEFNARNQLTLWGPRGEISDYACKQWAGLVREYYKPRWQLFHTMLLDCLDMGTKFNQTAYNILAFDTVEQPFTFDRVPIPDTPTGDPVQISSNLYKLYVPAMSQSVDWYRHVKNARSKNVHKTPWDQFDVTQWKYGPHIRTL